MHTGALSALYGSRQYNSSACVLKREVIPDRMDTLHQMHPSRSLFISL